MGRRRAVVELQTAADIFEEAARTGEPTNVIADRKARKIIADAA